MIKRSVTMLVMGMMLCGCHMFINIPPLIVQESDLAYRDEYVNKGVIKEACEGRVLVVNESSVRVQAWQDNYSSTGATEIVADGIPYEHIVVEGYNQYGQLIGRTEKTFLCTRNKTVERWIITDPKLWWQQQ